MIDEAMLEELLAQAGAEIVLPRAGPERVLSAIAMSSTPRRRSRPNLAKPLAAVAAAVAVVALAVPVLQSGMSSSSSNDSAALMPNTSVPAQPGGNTAGGPTSGSSPGGPLDGAKIVKTGTLDLQVPHATLRTAVNRVTGVTVGLGGYVANSKTSYNNTDPTAQITVRVPAADFETAIDRLEALPGVKVLSSSENGTDVTAQYRDLEAQLASATAGRNALLVVLSQAETVGDILAVQDRVTAAQTQVEQLQGRIDVLGDQATFSSLAVTISEKPSRAAAALQAEREGGIANAWDDAREGFSNGIEWIIARSGGALIVLLAALALLFGIRYLYPIVRRGLV